MINAFMMILQGYQSKFCFPLELKEGVLSFALDGLYSDFDLALLAYGKWVYTSYSHMLHIDKLSNRFYKQRHNKNTDFMLPPESLRVKFIYYNFVRYQNCACLIRVNIYESYSEIQENNF